MQIIFAQHTRISFDADIAEAMKRKVGFEDLVAISFENECIAGLGATQVVRIKISCLIQYLRMRDDDAVARFTPCLE